MRFIKRSPVHICLFLFLFITMGVSYSQNFEKPQLKFNKTGLFKIIQFTDIHFIFENKPRYDSVIAMMTTLIKSEKPDLVVMTGDIVTSKNVKDGWKEITKPMRDAAVPWAVAMGNHEFEHGLSNKQIMDYLLTLPYNVSLSGAENVSGTGNYILSVVGSKTNGTAALLYFFDSHNYTGANNNLEPGIYDWIKFDQINWYRTESSRLTLQNDGKPYPAFAFLHIPLPEYAEVQKKKNTVGDNITHVASPKINSGLFNAFYEAKDVMAVFCGHDHNNTFIGTFNNIALAYGAKTGFDDYWKLNLIGRVIVLYEGERKFDTWISALSDPVKYFTKYPDSFSK